MSAKNTVNSFGYVAKNFHWLLAFLIISMLIFGYFLDTSPALTGESAHNIHKMIGITVLALVILRLFWRWINIQPSYSSTLPSFYKIIVRLAHYAIYLVIFLMPLSGWVMSTASGHIPHFFADIYLPMPGISLNEQLAGQMYQVHNFLAIALIALISVHIVAALFHHFILRDNVLTRILPGK